MCAVQISVVIVAHRVLLVVHLWLLIEQRGIIFVLVQVAEVRNVLTDFRACLSHVFGLLDFWKSLRLAIIVKMADLVLFGWIMVQRLGWSMLMLFLLLFIHLEWVIVFRVHIFNLPFRMSSLPSFFTAWSRWTITHCLTFAVLAVCVVAIWVLGVWIAHVLVLVVHVDARARLVVSVKVAMAFGLCGRTIVRHWDVIGASWHLTNWSCVILLCVGITRLWDSSLVLFLTWVEEIWILMVHLSLLLNFSQSFVKWVFTVSRNIFIVFCFIDISRS